jgi:hypothetical protein
MPIWIINTNGDPNYVLYYEAFPASDAVGWEVYQNMQNRLVVPYNGGDGDTYEDVEKFMNDVEKKAEELGVNPLEGIIINNIILNSNTIISQGERVEGGTGLQSGNELLSEIPDYGDWSNKDYDETPSAGDNFYKFSNYMSLNAFEKSAIKYIPCGDHTLCLKTREGVYTFPLRNCNNIKSVQLIYNGAGDENYEKTVAEIVGVKGSGTVRNFIKGLPFSGLLSKFLLLGKTVLLYDLVSDVIERHVSFKISNFGIVSPCSIDEAKITLTSCKKTQPEIPGYIDSVYEPCTNVIKYPLFQYDPNSEKLNVVRKNGEIVEHYMCVESVGTSIHDLPGASSDKFSTDDVCLQVEITKIKDDYCWTPNPYKDVGEVGFWGQIKDFFAQDLIRGSITYFLVPPVQNNSAYIADTQTIVLGPTDIAMERGKGFFDAFQRKWWWGWP